MQKTLTWEPAWYENDQPLIVGQTGSYLLWKGEDRLYNSTHLEEAESVQATIESIHHPLLGDIQAIDTDGLDYTFLLVNGDAVVVNAEEEPGSIVEGSDLQIDDWTCQVTVSIGG